MKAPVARVATILLGLAFVVVPASIASAQTQPVLRGDTEIHDPSMVFTGGVYVSFATGSESDDTGGMPRLKTSPDGIVWTDAGTIPGGLPAWIAPELGYAPSNIWAPSISLSGNKAWLYYSASSFGNQDSAIGLMTNAAFDPVHPAAGWTDQGLVVRSHKGGSFNAIDAFRIDDGTKSWLVFGSWWDGIRLVALDPATGKQLTGDEPIAIASRQGRGIEAPSILHRGDWFYLFSSFDRCCRGSGSTYKIAVGRAAAITGPYLDRDGKPMLENGGTIMLASEGDRRGPGGQEAFMVGDEPWLVWHYYDRKLYGLPRLQIAPLRFDADGWPFLDPAPVE